MKVFIAAGHGGGDPGSLGNNTTEAAEVIKLVDDTVQLLSGRYGAEIEIIQIDNKMNLQDEVAIINKLTTDPNKDIAIEIHMNNNTGSPGTGIETYFGKRSLAENLQKTLIEELGMIDRGVKEGNWLYFNNSTHPGSALIEIGFLNNVTDLVKVRESGAHALAMAIVNAVGVKLPTPNQPEPPKEPNTGKIAQVIEKLKEIIAILLEYK